MSVRTMGRAAAFVTALILSIPFVVLSAPAAQALDQSPVPQPVADYFAHGLIPRLIDLYGSGDGMSKGTDFDATTKVGTISRVREWTPDFLAGTVNDDPTRLTNDWVAPVSLHGAILGLATVWINPANDRVELATFESADFARQVTLAPKGSWLVHDAERGAWFALTEDALIPLVAGSSGVSAVTTTAEYQRRVTAPVSENGGSTSGVAVAALVLGIVVLGVAIFVLLPVKRKGTAANVDDDDDEIKDDDNDNDNDNHDGGGVDEDDDSETKPESAQTPTT